MASRLMRKLSLLNASSKPETPPRICRVMRYEAIYPADEGLLRLNQTALLRMGLTGGCFDIRKAVFLDTETTGLSGGAGTVAFLVGYGFWQNHSFVVRQLLMPDYSAEPELLEILSEELSGFETVVHFNGRRFDMPLLSQRYIMKRMNDGIAHLEQLDLLYPARNTWKLRLGCCRLSYLESHIFGMPERDDIPGAEIPGRYFESVRSGDLSGLQDVIEHNRQDIRTLGILLSELNRIFSNPESLGEVTDLYSLGKTFERQGEYKCARGLYLKASRPRPIHTASDLRDEKYAGEANKRLYALYRRMSDYEKCEQTLLCMVRRGQLGSYPHLELAKLYEHHLKDFASALRQCEWLTDHGGEDTLALEKRKARIRNKAQSSGRKQTCLKI